MSNEQWVCYRDESASGGRSLYVRAWQAGDGLRCTHASKGHRFECGPPVASVKSVNHGGRYGNGRKFADKVIRSVVCADHLATHFSGVSVGELNAEAEESARQKVIANHWAEYIEALEELRTDLRDDSLGQLPPEIAEAIKSGVDA